MQGRDLMDPRSQVLDVAAVNGTQHAVSRCVPVDQHLKIYTLLLFIIIIASLKFING